MHNLISCENFYDCIKFHASKFHSAYNILLQLSSFPRLNAAPENLDQLGDSLGLLERLQAEKPKTEAQFQPLSDQFDILKKYEVLIPDPVSHL